MDSLMEDAYERNAMNYLGLEAHKSIYNDCQPMWILNKSGSKIKQ